MIFSMFASRIRIFLVAGTFIVCATLRPVCGQDNITAQAREGSIISQTRERTIIVSAVGRADPEADAYKRDRSLMLEDLRADAKKQCIEKAVGSMVSAQSMVENYALIEDRIHTRTAGLIKRVIEEGAVEDGSDGFSRMVMTAEVYLSGIEEALDGMSRFERIDQIKDKGNPAIAVGVTVRNATRSGPKHEERSELAENILKEMFTDFGYRVWSEGESASGGKADFVVTGEVQFEYEEAVRMGVPVQQHKLLAWTIKCVDGTTGEQLLFNNEIPRQGRTSWSSEAAAQEDIGTKIGEEFNKEFFDRHLMKPSTIYQLVVKGLSDYDSADEIRAEFLGLRSILNADLRDFDQSSGARFEVDVIGKRSDFLQILNNVIVKPLNEKYGKGYLAIKSAAGQASELHINEALRAVAVSAAASTSPAEGTNPVKDNQEKPALTWIVVLLAAIGAAGGGYAALKKRKNA